MEVIVVKKKIEDRVIPITQFEIIDYSPKAIAIFGEDYDRINPDGSVS